MGRTLITGAAGFVGTNLSNYLIKKGYGVVGIDLEDRHNRLRSSLLLNHPQFQFIKLDLAKNDMTGLSLDDIDVIFHLAALPHVDYSQFHPRRTLTNNVNSLLTTLELALKLSTPLILASSVEVYGGVEDKLYTEEIASAPLSPYAASKVASEAIVKSYIETQGLVATTFRFTNYYGPWQAPDRLLPRVIAQVLSNCEVTVEKGTNRDFVFIEDACEVLEKAIRFNHQGEVFNLSSGIRTDNYDAIQKVTKKLPTSKVNVIEPRRNDGRGKFLVSSPEKLTQETNWQASTNLDDGIVRTIEWYQNQSKWLAKFRPNIDAPRDTDKFLTDSGLQLAYW